MNGNRPLVTTFFVVQLYDPGTGSGFGPLNYFDLEIARTVNVDPQETTIDSRDD